jgi:hypothetical protein
MAARILVVAAIGALQRLSPQRRRVQPEARCDLLQRAWRDADVGNVERAAAAQSFERIMAGLGAKERHRPRRHRRAAHDLPAVAMQPARHVDGHCRQRLAIDAIDELPGDAFDGSSQASAEQRIDHQRASIEEIERHRRHLADPTAGRQGCIAFQRCTLAKQGQTHRPAPRLEMSRRHETVAAVVAGAAQHDDRLAGMVRRDGGGHRPAGGLHEVDARHAGRDRGGVGSGHLGAGQEGEVVAGF